MSRTRSNSRTDEEIDVASEVMQLRQYYDILNTKRKKEEEGRKKVRDPTKGQLRLYEEGKRKLIAERFKPMEDDRNAPTVGRTRSPSPIPICDRLYEEGMNKVAAEKMAEKRQQEELEGRQFRPRNPSPIPICDRLYEEGMNKVMAEKMARKVESLSLRRPKQPVASIPICDRLYHEGLIKIRAEKEKQRRNTLNVE